VEPFLETAESGDEAALQAMVVDPALAPVLARATSGLKAAANQIPGRDAARDRPGAARQGADTTVVDKSGLTALQRAQKVKAGRCHPTAGAARVSPQCIEIIKILK
jgi:hypothetical protein